VLIALVAALLAGAAVFAWAKMGAGGGAAKQTETTDTVLGALSAKYDATRAELDATKAELDALKTAAAKASGTAANPGDTTSGTEQYTLIKKVYLKGGTWYITADYIQFLTGTAAAAAATAHGDESPPPNDYYIANDNPQLRELSVVAGANVKIEGGNGGDPANPQNKTIAQFHDWYYSSNPDQNWVKSGIYVLTLSGTKVTAINEQFVP
jgi:hypothetical protein